MKRHFKAILLLLICVLIFYFSHQISDDSIVTTNVAVSYLYDIYALIFKNSIDIKQFTDIVFHPLRKIAHFSEYMILGIIAYLHISDFKKNRVVIYAIIFSSLYAISDEIHQYFIPGRACAITDMLIDSTGAIFGILLIHLISKKWKKD